MSFLEKMDVSVTPAPEEVVKEQTVLVEQDGKLVAVSKPVTERVPKREKGPKVERVHKDAERFSALIDKQVLANVRYAVSRVAGYTLTQFIEDSLSEHLVKFMEEHEIPEGKFEGHLPRGRKVRVPQSVEETSVVENLVVETEQRWTTDVDSTTVETFTTVITEEKVEASLPEPAVVEVPEMKMVNGELVAV